MKREPWYGNGIGLSNTVMSPWHPVQVDDDQVSVWGRSYRFRKGALPTGIKSAGKEMLCDSVLLKVSSDETTDSLLTQNVVFEQDEERTYARASSTIQIKNHSPISVSSRVEYDGMILVELSSHTLMKDSAKSVVIDIPIQNDHARYRHVFADSAAGGVSGFVPSGTGVVEKRSFTPYYWIGDDTRGLFWFCESDVGWPNGNRNDAIELVRTDQAMILRLNIKKKGQQLQEEWKFRFGLQATPVKPLPAGWRKKRIEPAQRATIKIQWPQPRNNSLRFYGYPEVTDPRVFEQEVRGVQRKKQQCVTYLCLTFLSSAAPEWKRYEPLWSAGDADASSKDVTAYGTSFSRVNPLAPGWSDFIVWKTLGFLDTYGIDGLYHDNTRPYPVKPKNHLRPGRFPKEYPIIGYRELYKRMYAAFKQARPDGFSMAHVSGFMNIPVLSFEDAYLEGEQFRGRVKDDYLDVVSLEAFRAEFIGRQWGLIPLFLPEFRPPYSDRVEPTRGLMTLLMLHDVAPWPEWCNVKVVNDALSLLDYFGYADAEFIPYFAPAPPATTEMKGVYASGYRKEDGSTLLIVGNLGKKAAKGTIRVSSRLRGDVGQPVKTWPSGRRVSATGNEMAVELPGQSYAMFVVGGDQ